MCLMLFAMQWLLIHRNTPKDAMDSPQFRARRRTAFCVPGHLRGVGRHLCRSERGAVLADHNLWNFGQTLCQLRWLPAPGSEAGGKAERDHERENRHRAASGLPSFEEERAAAAREEPTCAASVKSRSPAAIADSARTCSRQALMAYGRGYGDALRPSSLERFEVLYCLHYAAMPECKRIQDLHDDRMNDDGHEPAHYWNRPENCRRWPRPD